MSAADVATAGVIRHALRTDATTSDPGLNWFDLVTILDRAAIWPGASQDQLRIKVAFALRAVRKGDATNPPMAVICDPSDGWVYRLAIDRTDAGQWLHRTGYTAIKRAEHLVTYTDVATALFGHDDPATGPALWIAARAQLSAAHTTLLLAHDASF